MSAQGLTNKMNNREEKNGSSDEEEYESRFDLDSIIEREGISGLVRVAKELYLNISPDLEWIQGDKHTVVKRYIYEKFDAIRRFLNLESLFENTNPALLDETPKQRFLRYEEFMDDLKRRDILLSQDINYDECFKKITSDNFRKIIVTLNLLAFDYLMDMSAFCHYLSLLEKTGWIRKKQSAVKQDAIRSENTHFQNKSKSESQTGFQDESQDEEISQSEILSLDNLDNFLDRLASEYAGHLRQFCSDTQLLFNQKPINLFNLANSSLKETTARYLHELVEGYELADKVDKYGFGGRAESIATRAKSLDGKLDGRAQKPLPPSYFSSAILKSHETPFIVQWEQEKDFRGYTIEKLSLDTIIASGGLVLMLGSISLGAEIFRLMSALSFPVAIGLVGAMCYITGALVYECDGKLDKWYNELDKKYVARNEPLIERIINDRKVFEVYTKSD